MTAVSWPGAVPFDPDSGAASRIWEELLGPEGDAPASLLLVSGEAARYSGWAGRVVVELAEALASRTKVLLVDLHFDAPDLGELAAPGAEGLADILVFGSSLEHAAAPAAGRSFRFVGAGPGTGEVEELFRHSAWARLLEEAAREQTVVLAYAPWRARGLDALISRFDATLFLGGTADARMASGYLPPDTTMLGVLTPFAPVRTISEAGPAAPAAPPKPSREPERVRAKPPSEPLRRAMPWLVALLVLVAAAAASVWYGLARGDLDPADPLIEAPAPDPGEPVAEPAAYSVAIESYEDLTAAAERMEELVSAEPTMGFYLTPILVDSVLDYRVMAGPVRDSAEAGALQAELVARGHKAASSEWDIRSTPLAFLLGVHDTLAEADARADDLAGIGIPAYVLEVPYSTGTTRYHLYCGAYAGPAEAEVMQQLLDGAGLEAELVQRVGHSPT